MSGQGVIVLVADDDPAIRLLCRVNLELEGYHVLEASDGASAEAAVEAEEVKVVLLDVHLGEDDGREVVLRLREKRPGIAVAFFSGSVSVDALRGTVDGVVPKPFSLEELSGTVRRLAQQA